MPKQWTHRCPTKSVSPIPTYIRQSLLNQNQKYKPITGANGVAECFSAANMSTAMTNVAVMNISMNTAWARFTPSCRNVL